MPPTRIGHRLASLAVISVVLTVIGAACTAAPSSTVAEPATPPISASPTVAPTPEPTPSAAPTPVPTPAPTPFVAGTTAAPRVISVAMVDPFRFEPATITVQAGETIEFQLENVSVIPHDFTLGDEMAQAHHEAEMASGDMHHDRDANAIMVEPGRSGTLTYTFGAAGELLIGCHVPGHYDAGMRGTVEILASVP